MDLASYWVLPLEASALFGVGVSVVLNCLEDLGTQLSSERAKRSLLLQILNDNVLQIVHLQFDLYLIKFKLARAIL